MIFLTDVKCIAGIKACHNHRVGKIPWQANKKVTASASIIFYVYKAKPYLMNIVLVTTVDTAETNRCNIQEYEGSDFQGSVTYCQS